MFDDIKNSLFCPFCGIKIKGNSFQTKSFSNSMDSLDIYKIRGIEYQIYVTCRNCGNWIELMISENGIKRKKNEMAKKSKK